ncbi:MAG: ATP-dependent Clp protease adaptor protein ClpS [Myxococcota bacterium]|jgi:ATP-dependent Clp protease adaptor protein ClpS
MAGSDKDNGKQHGVVLKERAKAKRPKLYRVLFHNDDFTTMEFVVLVLRKFFEKDRAEATRVMLEVHQTGIGMVAAYAYEVAETKVNKAAAFAKAHDYPLRITMEPE